MPKLVLEKKMENIKMMFLRLVKPCKTNGNTSKFEVFARLSANRKFIKQPSKMRSTIVPKSMRKQNKILARRSNATNIETLQKMSPKGKFHPKQDSQNDRKREACQVWYGESRGQRNTHTFKDNSSEENLPKEKVKFRKMKFR